MRACRREICMSVGQKGVSGDDKRRSGGRQMIDGRVIVDEVERTSRTSVGLDLEELELASQ